jgi:aconitate hydratase
MARQQEGFFLVGGNNYGQGSSREHAAIAPRYLGLKIVIAKSFARIHWQNLANFGMLPVTFVDPADYDDIDSGDDIRIEQVRAGLKQGSRFSVENRSKKTTFEVQHALSRRQVEMILAGSLINEVRNRKGSK